MEIRECKQEERLEAIELINSIFRTPLGLDSTMEKEFPLLLGEKNIEHMILGIDKGKVVSAVNYYTTDIIIEGTPLKVASIGAVCTKESYRGQNLVTKILDYAEEKMKKEEVLFEIISGSGGVYEKRGARKCGKSYRFSIDKFPKEKEINSIYEINEYSFQDFNEITAIYNRESIKYYRSYEEFKSLMNGATFNWGHYEFKVFCIKRGEKICAYVVVAVNKKLNIATIKEFAGCREGISHNIGKLYDILKVEEVILECPWSDEIVSIFMNQQVAYKEILQPGSIKILNFKNFIKALTPYFAQYIPKEYLDLLRFEEEEDKFKIYYGDQVIYIDSIHNLSKIIFGSDEKILDSYENNEDIIKALKKLFPIPFVWTWNMNFQ